MGTLRSLEDILNDSTYDINRLKIVETRYLVEQNG